MYTFNRGYKIAWNDNLQHLEDKRAVGDPKEFEGIQATLEDDLRTRLEPRIKIFLWTVVEISFQLGQTGFEGCGCRELMPLVWRPN